MTAVALTATACHHVPKSVVQPDEMAALLADIYTAEAMVDAQRHRFMSDSSRLAVKQAVLAKYGVDQAMLDSSYSWYAHNPERYVEVCDNTIEILRERLKKSGAAAAGSAMSAAGDSVDIWRSARFMAVTDRSPSRFVTFNIRADKNSKPGDVYDWHVKFFNNMPRARWTMAVDYTDGSSEWISTESYNEGWNSLRLMTDSTRTPREVYGTVELQPYQGASIYLDSIRLTRRRIDHTAYPLRYNQRSRK